MPDAIHKRREDASSLMAFTHVFPCPGKREIANRQPVIEITHQIGPAGDRKLMQFDEAVN